jgi:hypothetical protein
MSNKSGGWAEILASALKKSDAIKRDAEFDFEPEENTLRMYRGRHIFTFNPDDNGGQSFRITTDITVEDKEEAILEHEITLQSYGNKATFFLHGVMLTPAKLRQMADELEKKIGSVAAGISNE